MENEKFNTLTDEQKTIYQKAMNGENLFITGGAGTGKSYLLNTIIETLENEDKNVLVAAPTGMAAVTIQGVTLHKLFKVGIGIVEDRPITAKNLKRMLGDNYDLIHEANTLIIDEISMCRADLFSRVARIVATEGMNGHNIQIILCGDFFQLPPVINQQEKSYFTQINNPEGWAFNTPEWKSLNIQTCQLNKIIRQKNPDFAKALNEIRHGNPNGLQYICNNKNKNEPSGISLCGTNKKANEINTREMKKLNKPLVTFSARVTYNPNNLNEYKEICSVTDSNITLCENAKVIITTNDREGKYFNGTTGIIQKIKDEKVKVKIDDTDEIVTIKPKNYSIYNYEITAGRKVSKEKIFSFEQIPLKPGWAITIHKSQGRTYNKMVLETGSMWPMEGLLYVALSRITNIENLSINGWRSQVQNMKQLLKTSQRVQKFYRS